MKTMCVMFNTTKNIKLIKVILMKVMSYLTKHGYANNSKWPTLRPRCMLYVLLFSVSVLWHVLAEPYLPLLDLQVRNNLFNFIKLDYFNR